MDGEWTIPAENPSPFESPFGLPGWNVFQYKARSIAGGGRSQAFANLCNGLQGALPKLLNRLGQAKQCRRYCLFTNLQVGLETSTETSNGAILNKQRDQLVQAITGDGDGTTSVTMFDAAQLAAFVNAHPAIRLTFFSGPAARSWIESWNAEQRLKSYKVSTNYIGRKEELNQINIWLNDTTTKVIVLCGPSGMGKTRLALEATRPFPLTTTIVEVVDELLRMDFQVLGTSDITRFIIVEDPTRDQAEALAKQAVASEGVKLVLTVPTDSKAPAPKLTEHEAVKTLPPLKPLENNDAENLLKSAGALFDRQALNWILVQAGGNPEILLSAAELKDDLREKSGDLKRGLYERYRFKIEKELGPDGIRTLKALSPILYVKHKGENAELDIVCNSLDLGIQPSRIVELLPDLERMGYVRKRGKYVSVVPPLFAAHLIEELVSSHETSIQSLFSVLSKSSRERFLERMITVDLPEKSSLWDYVFRKNGPIENGGRMSDNFDHLDCLARAVPGRTARFIEAQLNQRVDGRWVGYYLIGTLQELICHPESCITAMRCLELLALQEIEQTNELKEAKLFCECFVDWNYSSPMSYHERSAWIGRLLKSENRFERLLAVRVVVFVTAPPQTLSAHTVTARRLGQSPPKRMWQEIYDYVAGLTEVRFQLTQSADKEIAKIAVHEFEDRITELMGHVSPDQITCILEKLVDWHFNRKLSLDVAKIRSSVHWVEQRYIDTSRHPSHALNIDKWTPILQRLAALRERIDGADFLTRLIISIGHMSGNDWEPRENGRVYAYQKRLHALALEVVNDPFLMTDDAWRALKERKAEHASEFIQFIGELDRQKMFLERVESEIGDRLSNWRFGFYCFGLHRMDSVYVEEYLNSLAVKDSFAKKALLWPIRLIGATPTNRARLLRLIANNSVTPIDVAEVIIHGPWLGDVPLAEVVAIFEFFIQGDDWPERMAEAINQYLYLKHTLPNELIPFGELTLREIGTTYDNNYKCNHIALAIAKGEMERGFGLLEKHVGFLNQERLHERQSGWNPFERCGGREFWDHLRSQNAERAYRSLLKLNTGHVNNEMMDPDCPPFLDLQCHREIILKIASENQDDAERIVSLISLKQPGFFAFSFDLLSIQPVDGKIFSYMSSTIVERFGFGSPLEKLKIALANIESELNRPEVPIHGRLWLERLKHKMQEAVQISPWSTSDNEYLGWF